MKSLIFILTLGLLFSCSGAKKTKVQPDTCYTDIEFKNIFAQGYPSPPATSVAIRIIRDSTHVDDNDIVTHQMDSFYYVPFTSGIPDGFGKLIKSKVDPTKDSITVKYMFIPNDKILHDWNKTDPYSVQVNAPVAPQPQNDSTKIAGWTHKIDSIKAKLSKDSVTKVNRRVVK